MDEKVNVFVFSPFYMPGYKGGGPIKTIKNLFDKTGSDISYKLITSDRDFGDVSPYASIICGAWSKVGNALVFYARPGKVGYVQAFRELCKNNYDLVYLNSFFSSRFSLFPLLVTKILRGKVLLAPRGELSEGALSIKSFKKRVFITFFKLLGLHRNTIFQASTDYEKEDVLRNLGGEVDVYIAENIGAQEFAQHLPERTPDTLKAVFVSRISPKKNLLTALEILHDVKHPLEFDIFGPIEDVGYWQQCEKVIAILPSHIKVIHKGSLSPDEVVNTLSNYDVFFFPTKGENYGHVIAEALCAALPIVIADTTPWRNLEQQGLGWDLSLNNPNSFSDALDELSTMSSDEHLKMRQNILAWAKNKFSQRDAIEANIAMFKYAYAKK